MALASPSRASLVESDAQNDRNRATSSEGVVTFYGYGRFAPASGTTGA
jgi:hypothetical protein